MARNIPAGLSALSEEPRKRYPDGRKAKWNVAQTCVLHLPVEVNEQVPARDQVEARKWRILEKAVLGEQSNITQFAGHLISVAFAGEKSFEPLLGHVGFDGGRIAAFSGRG